MIRRTTSGRESSTHENKSERRLLRVMRSPASTSESARNWFRMMSSCCHTTTYHHKEPSGSLCHRNKTNCGSRKNRLTMIDRCRYYRCCHMKNRKKIPPNHMIRVSWIVWLPDKSSDFGDASNRLKIQCCQTNHHCRATHFRMIRHCHRNPCCPMNSCCRKKLHYHTTLCCRMTHRRCHMTHRRCHKIRRCRRIHETDRKDQTSPRLPNPPNKLQLTQQQPPRKYVSLRTPSRSSFEIMPSRHPASYGITPSLQLIEITKTLSEVKLRTLGRMGFAISVQLTQKTG